MEKATCPTWCSLGADHLFTPDLDSPDGDAFRQHWRLVGAQGRLRVTVEAYETRRRGWRTSGDPAAVTVYLNDSDGCASTLDDLTPGEARMLAGLLVEAADAIEAQR